MELFRHRFFEIKIALACLSLAWLTLPATAQNIQPIYFFTNGPAQPDAALVQGPDGKLYGTSSEGGSDGYGAVFTVTTNGSITTLLSFGVTNGARPNGALTLGPDANFWGTTVQGGSSGYGTVFRISTNGTLITMASFAVYNGAFPYATLTLGPDGNFYGTTESGGSNGYYGYGTVFRMTTNGAVTTLTTFVGTNGANPYGALALGPDGNFYGTTARGGITNSAYPSGMGNVFKVTTNGALTTLASFAYVNGANPQAGLTLGPDGNFYGTTEGGGNNNVGTVFRIRTNGTLTTLASFASINGAYPWAGLTLGPDGNFYGTTEAGGGSSNDGTVFRISTNGALTTLASFNGYINGLIPIAGLALASDGNFYGTTILSGSSPNGTVFRISTNGNLTSLATLSGTNQISPYAGLTLGSDGNFYGTVPYGGTSGYGTVFQITTNGSLTILSNFDRTNGAYPRAGLTLGLDGNFYGATYSGGTNGPPGGWGTIFQITTNGTLTTLADFASSNGAIPYAGLALGPDGNFYGATAGGGSANYGTVFRITTNGTLATLANFNSTNGADPWAGLTLGLDGNFYGTTVRGGSSNDGTVFQITTNGTLTTLVNFTGTNGVNPYAALTLGPDGNFYGNTEIGGTNSSANAGATGWGTIFQITTNGAFTMLADFAYTNGALPWGSLTLAPDGNFYGTTYGGGTIDDGTVFRINTDGILTTLLSFNWTNGANPRAGLTLGPDGSFYGTTESGGAGGGGMIYRLNLPPSIFTQPSNQIVTTGSSATFTIGVFGTASIEYQWFYNGTPITSATNNTLTIADVALSSTGNYEVIITNNWGSATSSIATLSFPAAPMITNQPASESVPIGGKPKFVVGATGNPPPAYQWYFNTNTPLAGATNAVLSFGPVLTSQAGNYEVIVANPYGSATSSAATLTVLLQPNCYGISSSGSGTMTLLLASTPNSTNRLWATTNLSLPLAQWQPISTNAADPTGLFQFTDTNTGNTPARFYILSSP